MTLKASCIVKLGNCFQDFFIIEATSYDSEVKLVKDTYENNNERLRDRARTLIYIILSNVCLI